MSAIANVSSAIKTNFAVFCENAVFDTWFNNCDWSFCTTLAVNLDTLSYRSMSEAKTVETGKFLVCGLGSLGQYCVVTLKEFGASVNAICLEEVTN